MQKIFFMLSSCMLVLNLGCGNTPAETEKASLIRPTSSAKHTVNHLKIQDKVKTLSIKSTRSREDSTDPACEAAVIGKACTKTGTECGSAGVCLLTVDENNGVCSCGCTPDNAATGDVNEDSCPDLANHRCVIVKATSTGVVGACMQTCTPKIGSNGCKHPKLACDPNVALNFRVFDAGLCLFPGCAENLDCPVITATTCNPTVTCTPFGGLGCCNAGETCFATSNEDPTLGICAFPGNCDVKSGLCNERTDNFNPNATIGTPCKSDLDCGSKMSCLNEQTDADGTLLRNGYCSIDGCLFGDSLTTKQCPAGSSCALLFTSHILSGGMCQKDCSMADVKGCRNVASDKMGDYECRYTAATVEGNPISTCDFIPVPCNFDSKKQKDCSYFAADKTNSTHMRCRLSNGTDAIDPFDPKGLCLDDSTSGMP